MCARVHFPEFNAVCVLATILSSLVCLMGDDQSELLAVEIRLFPVQGCYSSIDCTEAHT